MVAQHDSRGYAFSEYAALCVHGARSGIDGHPCENRAIMTRMLAAVGDPREFCDPAHAPREVRLLHARASESLAATTGQESAALDQEIGATLRLLDGALLASVFGSAPSSAVYRHLWRLLAQGSPAASANDLAGITFALPVVIVVAIEGSGSAHATLPAVLSDPAALETLLREHGALNGSQTFALANALVAVETIDLPRLPDLHASHASSPSSLRPVLADLLPPSPIRAIGKLETVHLRFIVGHAIAAAGANLLRDTRVGPWGMSFAQSLTRQLKPQGVSLLALPRAPQSLVAAVQQGRAAQREVSAQLFVGNALRKFRASVGEPTAVISAHRAPDVATGGELRLSLSSPFAARAAEGFRCALLPGDRVGDVLAMLVDLLRDCRIDDVRVIEAVHADRDPVTGAPLLFKAENLADATHASPHQVC